MQHTVGQTVGMIGSMAKALGEIKKAVGANEVVEYEDEEDPSQSPFHQHQQQQQMMAGSYAPPPGAQEKPLPFQTMPLGQGPDAPIYAYNDDGSPNITGMLMGNLPKAGPWLKGLAEGVASVLRTQQQQQHPGVGVGHVPQALPAHQPEPQMHQPIPQHMQPMPHRPVQRSPFAPPPGFEPQPSFVPEPVQQQPVAPPRGRPSPGASFVPSMDAVRQAIGSTQ